MDDDAVTRYCRASEGNDIPGILASLSPEIAFESPLSGRMVFRGLDDVAFLLTAVYGTIHELRWTEQIGTDATRTVIGSGRVGRLALVDAMVFDLDADGLIVRIRPHLRPWLGTTYFALLLGPQIARRPGVIRRALRG